MKDEDKQRLASLALELYNEQQEKAGTTTPVKCAWIGIKSAGFLVVVSAFGEHSASIAEKLDIPWSNPDAEIQKHTENS